MTNKPRIKNRKTRTEIKWFFTETHGYIFSEKYTTHSEWHHDELSSLFDVDKVLRGELHCISGNNWMCVVHVFGSDRDEEATRVGDDLLTRFSLEGFTMISHLLAPRQ